MLISLSIIKEVNNDRWKVLYYLSFQKPYSFITKLNLKQVFFTLLLIFPSHLYYLQILS